MIKLLNILIVLNFWYSSCFAQRQSIIDSLSNKLINEQNDTVKIYIQNQIIFEYIDSRIDTAFVLANQNLINADKLEYLNGQAVSLYLLAHIHQYKGNIQKVIDYAQKSLKLSLQVKNDKNTADIYNLMGKVYIYKGEQNQALTYCLRALEIHENIKDQSGIIVSLINIGNIYSFQKRYNEALSYYNNAIHIAENNQDSSKIVLCMNNTGDVYEQLQEYNRALTYYEKALKLKNSIANNQRIIITLLSNIGGIYIKQTKYYTGLPYLYQSLKLSQKSSYTIGIVQIAIKIAQLYTQINQLDSAKKYAFISLENATLIQSKQYNQQSYLILYEVEKKQKNFEKAIQYYEKSVQLNDSIFNEQKEKIFDELQTKYQTERQAQQIDLLKKENENKKIQTTLFIFGSIILILFVFVLIFFMLRIHKNNRLLHLKNLEVTQAKEEVKQINEEIKQINEHLEDLVETRTEELKHSVNNLLKQNQDLEQFSFIISHNIRSPIARILGLVNVFNVENMDDPFNLQILGHLEQAGENLDMVIKDLNKIVSVRKSLDVNKEEVNFESELNITLEHLTEQISKSNTKIDFVFNIACIHSIKGYVQSILYNLISNAIKYKAKNRSPVIHIKTEIVDKYVCLSIQDNGLGIDLANTDTYKIFGLYQRMHSHVQGKGMGLFLVKTQIESLGGKIEVKSELNAGTTFYVYFPN